MVKSEQGCLVLSIDSNWRVFQHFDGFIITDLADTSIVVSEHNKELNQFDCEFQIPNAFSHWVIFHGQETDFPLELFLTTYIGDKDLIAAITIGSDEIINLPVEFARKLWTFLTSDRCPL